MTQKQADDFMKKLNVPDSMVAQGSKQLLNLYNLFMKNDSTQVEINPLAIAHVPGFESKIFCVDAKLNFDDDAKFRNKDLHAMRDYVKYFFILDSRRSKRCFCFKIRCQLHWFRWYNRLYGKWCRISDGYNGYN